MGNSHCVPQGPRRFRASFSRKPSLKANREDGSRRLAGLFGPEVGHDGASAADRILFYIPGSDTRSQRSGNLDQPLLNVSTWGQQGVPVRDLGKVLHYAKVQLRFQHSQDTSDCYLELFPAHLYFQAHGLEGLTLQGLLPLTELSVSRLAGAGEEHALQITGPLPAPLLVLCPSEAELSCWLYHLEKQMALVRGLLRCRSASPQRPLRQRKEVCGPICASRVKLQHLPSQEQHERLLVLYPTSLAIFSEEPEGLCFKGQLPLSAVAISLEEKQQQTYSFLIEGRLIHAIRVHCASWEDCSHWLRCLRSVSPPSPNSFLVAGSGRGSLSSDGRTSWNLGCPAPPSTHPSHASPEFLRPVAAGCPAQPGPDQANPGCTSLSQRRSKRSPRSKARAEVPSPATPLHLDLDLTKLSLEGALEDTGSSLEAPRSPLYADPYTPPATSHHKLMDVRDLDEFLSAMRAPPGLQPSGTFPSVPVSVPVSDPGTDPSSHLDPHLLPKKGVSQRHRGYCKGREPRDPPFPQLVRPAREVSPEPPPPPPGGRSPARHRGLRRNSTGDEVGPAAQQKAPQLGPPEAGGCLTQWI
ncbi:pleckstrin homology domain-containing family N member 1 isoform X2 [Tamandua tetradactyla]|uniref:pleckstrin homology domain-containing family N member 1 isoform X2 n=1 Tax=Tamandua tetradactyla TaxID=48850 RepID=UPI004053C1B4